MKTLCLIMTAIAIFGATASALAHDPLLLACNVGMLIYWLRKLEQAR